MVAVIVDEIFERVFKMCWCCEGGVNSLLDVQVASKGQKIEYNLVSTQMIKMTDAPGAKAAALRAITEMPNRFSKGKPPSRSG